MTTSLRPDLTTQPAWPANTTARIVTRIGMTVGNPKAAVDIYTSLHYPGAHYASCLACGWTADEDTRRNKVVDQAQDHADGCTALPNPTA